MARALSQIVTVIRGSIGGITFTANQWHQILLRAKTAPVQPQTNPQSWVKNGFAFASVQWKALSQADRDLWDEYGDTVTYVGPMGDYTLPGRQIFMASLTFINYLNQSELDEIAPITDPPEIPGRYGFDLITTGALSAPGTGFFVSITNPVGETAVALIELSPAFNLTRLRYKGPFLSGSAVATGLPAGQATITNFDGLVDGLVYFVRIRGATSDTPHRLTKETILRVIATETAI